MAIRSRTPPSPSPCSPAARSSNDAVTNADGDARWVGNDRVGLELRGNVRVRIDGPDEYSDNTTDVMVTENRSITVTLQPTVTLSGQLSDPDGEPAGDDLLEFGGTDVHHGDDTITTHAGEFSVQPVEHSTNTVTFWQDHPNTDPAVADPKDGTVDVRALGVISVGTTVASKPDKAVPVGHTLTVTVRNESGDPVQNASVHVASVEGIQWHTSRLRRTTLEICTYHFYSWGLSIWPNVDPRPR